MVGRKVECLRGACVHRKPVGAMSVGNEWGGYNEMVWTQEEKTVECLRLGKGMMKTKGVRLKGGTKHDTNGIQGASLERRR